MKRTRIWPVLIALAVLLCACARRETDTGEQGFVSPPVNGETSVVQAQPVNGMSGPELVSLAQERIARGEEVFWWYMGDGDSLEVEQSDDYTAVVRRVGRFGTVAQLREATEAVYTRRFCEEILYPVGFNESQGENVKFREIDGALHINQNNGGMGWMSELTDRMELQSEQPGEIVVSVLAVEPDPESGQSVEVPVEFVILWEDDAWKLDNWYHYGTEALPTLRDDAPPDTGGEELPEQEWGPIEQTYDPQTGLLTLPTLGIRLTVPQEMMARVEVVGIDVAVPSDLDAAGQARINHMSFRFAGERPYNMFGLSRWQADEWDVPKFFGPLPIETARSADGRWVIVHTVSQLSAENPEDPELRAAMWELIDQYEDAIVGSVVFAQDERG